MDVYFPCSIPVPYISGANVLRYAQSASDLTSALGGNSVLSATIGGVAATCASLPLNEESSYLLVSCGRF